MNKPLPFFFDSFKSNLIACIGIGAFVFVFMGLYKPFNILRPEILNQQIFYYGLLTFLGSLFWLYLFKAVFKEYYDTDNGTVGKFFIYMLSLTLFLSLQIFLFNKFYLFSSEQYGFKDALRVIRNSALIAIFPAGILYGILRTRFLKENLILHNIPIYRESKEKRITYLVQTDTSEKIEIDPENFLYAEADNNYARIYSIEDGQVESKIYRITLKNLEEQLPSDRFLRVHRSYLIEKRRGDGLSGNTKAGFALKIKFIDRSIPVSRKHLEEVRELLSAAESR